MVEADVEDGSDDDDDDDDDESERCNRHNALPLSLPTGAISTSALYRLRHQPLLAELQRRRRESTRHAF